MAARRRLAWPVGIFFLALTLRLIHLFTIRSSPFFSNLGLDPLAYDEWGRRLAAGDWVGTQIFYQDPLYPYFLGVVYALFGHSFTAAAGLQLLLGALQPVLVYLAARHWLGHAAATTAGILGAVYLPSIFYEGLILKSWLGAFLVAAALYALSRALRQDSWRPWGAAGLLLGLGCLVRANLLLFLPVLGIWQLQQRRRLALPAVAALTAGALLVLAPTALRNRVVGGEWILTTSQGGQNFYIGNNPVNRNGRYEPLPFVGANPKYEEKGFAAEAERRLGHSLSAGSLSSYWFRQSLGWMRDHPGDWLRLTWRKLRTYWGAYEVPDNLDYYLYRETAPVLRLPLPGFGMVVPLGLLGGFWLIRRRGWPRALLLLLMIYSFSVVGFFVFARYRLAMMPAVFPLAGFALVECTRRLRAVFVGAGRAAAGRDAAVAMGLLLAAWSWVNLPVSAPARHWSYRLASMLHLPTRLETSATAHHNLGLSYARQAEDAVDPAAFLQLAVAEFRESLRQDPRFSAPLAEMGKALARLDRTAEAIEAYATVVRLEPGKPRPVHVLGLLQRRLGDLAGAEASFRRALALDSRRADSEVALGETLMAAGRPQEATSAFRRALGISPGLPEALAGLQTAGAGP